MNGDGVTIHRMYNAYQAVTMRAANHHILQLLKMVQSHCRLYQLQQKERL
jgi:hypothetical protein